VQTDEQFPETEAFVQMMQREQIDARAIDFFCALYRRYRAGSTGKIGWSEIEQPQPGDIVGYEELDRPELAARGRSLLGELVVIRLNGGLGTTMKLERAKSLIEARQGMSFLELGARQILALRERHKVQLPWLLMNSFRTRDDSLGALAGYSSLAARGLPLDFVQNKVPRIVRSTHLPASFAEPEDNWAPPGHGDIYLALWSTGLLERLHATGIRWAFVANGDNMGATVDEKILGFLAERDLEFAAEVTPKSLADTKGGTLIRHHGTLRLLESAQVEEGHLKDFQDITVFRDFNVNNLWWRVDALLERLRRGALDLDLIVNPKKVKGTDVVQLETAMGAAVSSFSRAAGIRVPRSRFAPVKATCDLLAVRSDAYRLDDTFAIRPSGERDPSWGPPVVVLDDRYYKGVEEFAARFPHPLSLVRCRSLTVQGDVRFGKNVRVEGEVTVRNAAADQRLVPDGAALGPGVHEL